MNMMERHQRDNNFGSMLTDSVPHTSGRRRARHSLHLCVRWRHITGMWNPAEYRLRNPHMRLWESVNESWIDFC
jgi:hypothetical protein